MSYFEIFPVEILTHIFMLVTHGDEKTSFSPYSVSCPVFDTTLVRTPVIISYVNCFWRHVTLNTPALWTSLCLTPEMILEDNNGENYLDRTFLDFFLVQSQMYPLDVLIKAQDPSWDYNRMEPECMLFMHNTDAMITYFLFLAYLLKQDQMFFCQFFFSHYMLDVVSTILSYIHWWRSLKILTDIWAPMFIALSYINPFLLTLGALWLEYLALSCCNMFASFSPYFYPESMKEELFFTSNNYTVHVQYCNTLLPNLCHLKLQGVHVQWSVLNLMLTR